MALKKTTMTAQGIEVVDAYHRVESASVLRVGKRIPSEVETYGTHTLVAKLCSFKDKDANVNFSEKMFTTKFDVNGVGAIEQAYNFIKSTSEFAGAEDC